MLISQESRPVACKECSAPALRVARLVSSDGRLLGQTVFCAECRRRRREHEPAAGVAPTSPLP
ncbi:hypothetical protein AB0K15_46955 [Amycolatopsis sp. NPDC049253]|uniref:hypothetical protein n=1 Tax=Amycolatopsis sp. NPDC049253 TaxID=3155274 RepID=UPI0034481BE6